MQCIPMPATTASSFQAHCGTLANSCEAAPFLETHTSIQHTLYLSHTTNNCTYTHTTGLVEEQQQQAACVWIPVVVVVAAPRLFVLRRSKQSDAPIEKSIERAR